MVPLSGLRVGCCRSHNSSFFGHPVSWAEYEEEPVGYDGFHNIRWRFLGGD